MIEFSIKSEVKYKILIIRNENTAGLVQHFQNDDRSPFYEFFIFLGSVLCNHLHITCT